MLSAKCRTYDFTVAQSSKVQLRDDGGWQTGDDVYRVRPKTYLVAGSLEQLRGHDDMITCFELFRSSLTSPEILTYDELYERAKCIVATISAEPQALDEDAPRSTTFHSETTLWLNKLLICLLLVLMLLLPIQWLKASN